MFSPNIQIIEKDGAPFVKILDFGVAKILAAPDGSQSVKTRTGSLMGTPIYMSPEQCKGAGLLDHRTDIYSLGVLIFEMLAGRPPFMAEGIGELFAKHMLEDAPPLLDLAPQTPPAAIIAGDQATPADVDRIRASLGLDRPFLVRFGEWLWHVINGDLGTSIFTNLPVTHMIAVMRAH